MTEFARKLRRTDHHAISGETEVQPAGVIRPARLGDRSLSAAGQTEPCACTESMAVLPPTAEISAWRGAAVECHERPNGREPF